MEEGPACSHAEDDDKVMQEYIMNFYKQGCSCLTGKLDMNNNKTLCYRVYDKELNKYNEDIMYLSNFENDTLINNKAIALFNLNTILRFYSKSTGLEIESERMTKLKKKMLALEFIGLNLAETKNRYDQLAYSLIEARLELSNRFTVEHSLGITSQHNKMMFYGDVVQRSYDKDKYTIKLKDLKTHCLSRYNFVLLQDVYENYSFFDIVGNVHDYITGSYVIGDNDGWIYRN
jgi:hypothetical protein